MGYRKPTQSCNSKFKIKQKAIYLLVEVSMPIGDSWSSAEKDLQQEIQALTDQISDDTGRWKVKVQEVEYENE